MRQPTMPNKPRPNYGQHFGGPAPRLEGQGWQLWRTLSLHYWFFVTTLGLFLARYKLCRDAMMATIFGGFDEVIC